MSLQLNYFKRLLTTHMKRTYSNKVKKSLILGIETSCDDTGCAVIDGVGNVLGESLYSQNVTHTRYGGVNPLIAHDLHRNNIEIAVAEALSKAGTNFADLDAIAVTTKPGLLVSLQVGVKYARYLARMYNKTLIPIHHMEAHALVARMNYDLNFPFLVLLISGGHCLLSLVQDVEEFLLLGTTLDNAPGEVFDKVARRMKLKNMPEYSKISGGKAVEMAALKGTNPGLFEFTTPLLRDRDCNFSFSGFRDALQRKLVQKEIEHQAMGCELIPEIYDLCAAFQLAVAEHLAHRTHRAITYCDMHGLISSEKRNVVVTGGVACNNFIFKSIEFVANKLGYNALRPPPEVCTDNGVMIAWNGLEKLRRGYEISKNIELDPTACLGINLIKDVKAADIPTKVTRLKNIISPIYHCVLLII